MNLETLHNPLSRARAALKTGLALALLATTVAPLGGATHARECCEPQITLDGFEEPIPDWPRGYGLFGFEDTYRELRAPLVSTYRDVIRFPYDLTYPLFGFEFAGPVPHYQTQYLGSVTIDVAFAAECECEVVDAWITYTEISDGVQDIIVPFLYQVDSDTWIVSAGDFDTYSITFHATYECENAPGGSVTTSWIQYN